MNHFDIADQGTCFGMMNAHRKYFSEQLVCVMRQAPIEIFFMVSYLRNGGALNVISNPSLESLGLTSLRAITDGLVYIKQNPKLCFLSSLKWKKLQDQESAFIDGNANQTSYCGM